MEDILELRRWVDNKIEMDLIRECAPTLAGLKTANLFNYKFDDLTNMHKELARINELLNVKGVYVRILRKSMTRALLYVYRPVRLAKDLTNPLAVSLLKKEGYGDYIKKTSPRECSMIEICEKAIKFLTRRVNESECFPHEIGLFLGYPAVDVKGFIEQKGQNCKCCGFWKVYGDEESSKMKFEQYRKCIEVYKKVFLQGRSLCQLTVSA
ncbi:DUF3793 family protein [Lachnospira pectinoschiza]|uniref:DUF3793 family protein n=1 Tax=Lachnospira pectinoschiza TaxID=28052 RepID=A0A1G9U4K1_9FIRM|nr:DUF3793 family protein [Lachnospira pectinoschiza]SDM54919.1 Protein of unknown function [Lachnospira pectinoschiza]